MKSTLAQRLEAVLTLLNKRSDLSFSRYRVVGNEDGKPPESVTDPRFNEELRQFAAKISRIEFSYEISDTGAGGSMALMLDLPKDCLAAPEWVPAVPVKAAVPRQAPSAKPPERAEPAVEAWIELDVPDQWNGFASRLALEPKSSSILCGHESTARYSDLESYLTVGASRGFVNYWPAQPESEDGDAAVNTQAEGLEALREASLPRNTSPAELQRRAQAAGIDAPLAADLVEWLREDLTLYFAR